MTRPLFCLVVTIVVGLAAAASAQGQVSLSLESSGVNLSQLRVGDTATIEVRLSGLQAGQELDALSATIIYEDLLLSSPVIASGPIIPDPLDDPWDFITLADPGHAEGSFLTFGTDTAAHVTSNGVFFTFDVTATDVGAGAFSFDFVDATQFNSSDPFDPIYVPVDAGEPLAFTVVPEPVSFMLVAIGTILLLMRRKAFTARVA